MIRAALAVLILVAAAGAALALDRDPVAQIRKADGVLAGRATVHASANGIRIRIQATRLPPGSYGVHVHAVGRCEGPGFETAGPHWNPAGRQHGSLNPAGPHLGDLPNLEVDARGVGRLEFLMPGATLRGGDHPLLDADGAAIVIHANRDDLRTDPSGNSGARIACGMLGAR
jgi:Cu-Zn family superoxide dismutase